MARRSSGGASAAAKRTPGRGAQPHRNQLVSSARSGRAAAQKSDKTRGGKPETARGARFREVSRPVAFLLMVVDDHGRHSAPLGAGNGQAMERRSRDCSPARTARPACPGSASTRTARAGSPASIHRSRRRGARRRSRRVEASLDALTARGVLAVDVPAVEVARASIDAPAPLALLAPAACVRTRPAIPGPFDLSPPAAPTWRTFVCVLLRSLSEPTRIAAPASGLVRGRDADPPSSHAVTDMHDGAIEGVTLEQGIMLSLEARPILSTLRRARPSYRAASCRP
jgi:hypothetical protein